MGLVGVPSGECVNGKMPSSGIRPVLFIDGPEPCKDRLASLAFIFGEMNKVLPGEGSCDFGVRRRGRVGRGRAGPALSITVSGVGCVVVVVEGFMGVGGVVGGELFDPSTSLVNDILLRCSRFSDCVL